MEFYSKKEQLIENIELKNHIKSGVSLNYYNDTIRDDKNICLLAINCDSGNYKYVSQRLHDDRDIIIETIKKDGKIFQHIPNNFRDDKEITLLAVKSYPYAIQYASHTLKHDRDVCLEVVKQKGELLEYIPIKDDKEIVLEAVKNNPKAMYYTTEDILLKYGTNHKILISNIEKELGIKSDILKPNQTYQNLKKLIKDT